MKEFENKVAVIKGGANGIAALTHALVVSPNGKVRVNSISPGLIDSYVNHIISMMRLVIWRQ